MSLKCPHCRKNIIQQATDKQLKIRVHGPLTHDLIDHTVKTKCYWCSGEVIFQAFFPAVQPVAPVQT